MVRVAFTPPVDAPAHAASATERAFANRIVREAIVRVTPPHLLANLGRVNRAFYGETHLPRVWARQHAPARVDWPSRTVFTAAAPLLPGERATAYEVNPSHPARPRRSLGTCGDEPWTLVYGDHDDAVRSDRTTQILDQVTSMHACEDFSAPLEQTREEAFRSLQEKNRAKAFAFMRDRLYRLENGLSVPIYMEGAAKVQGLGCCMFGAAIGGSNLMFAAWRAEGEWRFMAALQGALVCFTAASLCLLTILNNASFGGSAALRNAVLGPVDYVVLNRWARAVPALEAAAGAATASVRGSIAT